MRLKLAVIAFASMLCFAACGDDDPSDDGGTDTLDAGPDGGAKDSGGPGEDSGAESDAGSEDAGS